MKYVAHKYEFSRKLEDWLIKQLTIKFIDKKLDYRLDAFRYFLGTNKSKSNYYDIFDKWIPEEKVVKEEEEKPIGIALGKYALEHDMNPSTLRKMCREGKIPAIKINDKWYICVNKE